MKYSSDLIKEMIVLHPVGPVTSKKPLQQRVIIPSTMKSADVNRASTISLNEISLLKPNDSIIGALNLD